MPHGSRTPPTPLARSPPPTSPLSSRVREVAHLWPVSVPDIVRDMAGKDPQRKIADFDRHYMQDVVTVQCQQRPKCLNVSDSVFTTKALTYDNLHCRIQTRSIQLGGG